MNHGSTDMVSWSAIIKSKKIHISFWVMQTCAHICIVTHDACKWSHHEYKAFKMDKMLRNQMLVGNILSKCYVMWTEWFNECKNNLHTHSQNTEKHRSTNQDWWVLQADHSSMSLPFITCPASCKGSWIELPTASAQHYCRAPSWWYPPPHRRKELPMATFKLVSVD